MPPRSFSVTSTPAMQQPLLLFPRKCSIDPRPPGTGAEPATVSNSFKIDVRPDGRLFIDGLVLPALSVLLYRCIARTPHIPIYRCSSEISRGLLAAAHNAVIKHLALVRGHVVQDVSRVGDDEPHLGPSLFSSAALTLFVSIAAGSFSSSWAMVLPTRMDVFQIHAGFRFVKKHEVRILRHQLQEVPSA